MQASDPETEQVKQPRPTEGENQVAEPLPVAEQTTEVGIVAGTDSVAGNLNEQKSIDTSEADSAFATFVPATPPPAADHRLTPHGLSQGVLVRRHSSVKSDAMARATSGVCANCTPWWPASAATALRRSVSEKTLP
jgi:hypothetical protein